ncbi:MAG: aminodeoxychorismate synthase component I [Piscirickettsiaceae bacterium]|nr:MAG: aminodeoxychorismate synthase component I [Piscirickettsiaceae bacterium]
MTVVIENCGRYSKALIEDDVDLLACHQVNPKRYPFLLESHRYINEHSRFDILFAFPGNNIRVDKVADQRFFDELDNTFLEKYATAADTDELPFSGGWFVFLSYELAGAIENKLSTIDKHSYLPVAIATRIPVAVIKDHKTKQNWLVCESGNESDLEAVHHDLITSRQSVNAQTVKVSTVQSSSQYFLKGVKKIDQYLADGDTFQVNLSRQWDANLEGGTDYIDVYRALKAANPSPFAGLACIDGSYICSTSPERLVKTQGAHIEMRPIAGTRRRSNNRDKDQQLAKTLLNNDKENAEHIMLLDLIRNDLGRICEAGSINVDEQMLLESYATVHHIVSSVSGTIRPGITTPSDIIKAVFPGGTITGCPKVRCMEIINELENEPRGAYTGSMGYINHNGNMDLNILIRSVVINNKKLLFRAGAGIVADSVAEFELKETTHKAMGILNALG